MDTTTLSKLSPEQLSALNEEQKAIFCMLNESDQNFFSQTFKPDDLPGVLDRKGEILKQKQSNREQMEKFIKSQTGESPEGKSGNEEKMEDILTAVAGAVGIGAAATIVATDNSAYWQGVNPQDLLPALKNVFNNDKTHIGVAGNPDMLSVTISLLTGAGEVPALTIHLAGINNGTEVKMSELTSRSTFESIKEGGQKIIDIASQALHTLNRGKNASLSPEDLLSTADQALAQGTDLAELAGNMKLKNRAWKVIKETAEIIEKNHLDEIEQARKARLALETAWDRYYHCPTCGVDFSQDAVQCTVCGTSRPAKPINPDPRTAEDSSQ